MIVHRFVFLSPVQLPGRAPLTMWEPGVAANVGYEATRTADGWLFCGPPGALSGLSGGGADELAELGADREGLRLAVLVPHAQIVVHYALTNAPAWEVPQLPTSAPSVDAIGKRSQRKAEDRARAAEHARVAPPDPTPPPPPAVVAPTASKRRGPLPPAPPPPPSVGWVDES